ncbi:MAG TPA: universal stress protein [Gemmatimonadales bacterium]
MTRLLVPLDGSAFGETALPLAAAVAERRGSKLELVTVLASPSDPDVAATVTAGIEAEMRTRAQTYLEGLAERVQRQFDIDVGVTALDGEIASAIAAHAMADPPELIVMSTHGRTGPSRFILGSVADRLIRQLHCPFILVHPATPSANGELPAAARVLVPLDGSRSAESVLDEVARLFSASLVTLHLVRVVAPAEVVPMAAPMALPAIVPGQIEARLASAREYLERTASKLRKTGWHVKQEVLTEWMPSTGVHTYAIAHECDLIAIATRGLGGVQRMLLGSVADRVIRDSATPVLVVNPEPGAFSRLLSAEPESVADTASMGSCVLHDTGNATLACDLGVLR